METTIKTVEDAFAFTGRSIGILPNLLLLPEKDRKFIEAHYKLTVIAEALNKEGNNGQNWIPNWENLDERKYYPWVEISKKEDGSGFGFSAASYGYGDTCTNVGSRLCFISSERAMYALNQFEELYKDYFIMQ